MLFRFCVSNVAAFVVWLVPMQILENTNDDKMERLNMFWYISQYIPYLPTSILWWWI